jgi:hypothetical protein
MIRVNIHQLRKIVQQELGKPAICEAEGDITIDVISDFLADRLKTQLLAHSTSAARQFLESPLADASFFPSNDAEMRKMQTTIAQQVMTRVGPLMQDYVSAVVQGIIKGGMQNAAPVHEAFGSASVAPDAGDIKRDEPPTDEPQGMFVSKVDVISFEELPEDYEKCDCCGFDHEYEWSKAQSWHSANDME